MKPTSVAIIGLSQLFREALQGILRRSRFNVVSSTATLDESLASFAAHRPELALCAIAGGENTVARIHQLRDSPRAFDGVRVVLISAPLSADLLRDAVGAGVHAILSKEITGEVLQRSLELVMLGQQIFPPWPEELVNRPAAALLPFTRPTLAVSSGEPAPRAGVASVPPMASRRPLTAASPQRSTELSDRERQILRCLVEGASNKIISRNLQITEATVKVHIKGLLRKIQVSNRTQAAVWGLNNTGLLDAREDPSPERSDGFITVEQVAS